MQLLPIKRTIVTLPFPYTLLLPFLWRFIASESYTAAGNTKQLLSIMTSILF